MNRSNRRGTYTMQVLVVDDDAAMRKTIVYPIEALGHTATEALNAWDAWDTLDQIGAAPFNAVITDVQMPGGNGLELLQMLSARNLVLPTYVHSSDTVLSWKGQQLELPVHIATHFGSFASFQLKDRNILKNISAFLESIPTK